MTILEIFFIFSALVGLLARKPLVCIVYAIWTCFATNLLVMQFYAGFLILLYIIVSTMVETQERD